VFAQQLIVSHDRVPVTVLSVTRPFSGRGSYPGLF